MKLNKTASRLHTSCPACGRHRALSRTRHHLKTAYGSAA